MSIGDAWYVSSHSTLHLRTIVLSAGVTPRATTATPPEYLCQPGQRHIICQCCVQPMPDRQAELNVHQSCASFIYSRFFCLTCKSLGEICRQHFCSTYFRQCQRADCRGCLNQLRSRRSSFLDERIVKASVGFRFQFSCASSDEYGQRQCYRNADCSSRRRSIAHAAHIFRTLELFDIST